MNYQQRTELKKQLGITKKPLYGLNSGNAATYWLAQYLAVMNNGLYVSVDELIEFSTHSSGTVKQHLRDLERMNLLQVQRDYVQIKDQNLFKIEQMIVVDNLMENQYGKAE